MKPSREQTISPHPARLLAAVSALEKAPWEAVASNFQGPAFDVLFKELHECWRIVWWEETRTEKGRLVNLLNAIEAGKAYGIAAQLPQLAGYFETPRAREHASYVREVTDSLRKACDRRIKDASPKKAAHYLAVCHAFASGAVLKPRTRLRAKRKDKLHEQSKRKARCDAGTVAPGRKVGKRAAVANDADSCTGPILSQASKSRAPAPPRSPSHGNAGAGGDRASDSTSPRPDPRKDALPRNAIRSGSGQHAGVGVGQPDAATHFSDGIAPGKFPPLPVNEYGQEEGLLARGYRRPPQWFLELVLKAVRLKSGGELFSHLEVCEWMALERNQEHRQHINWCCEWLTNPNSDSAIPTMARTPVKKAPQYRLLTDEEKAKWEADCRKYGLFGFKKGSLPETHISPEDSQWI